MKRRFTQSAIAVTACLIAAPAVATNYECTLKMSRSGGNWMGPTVYVNYDEKNQTAKIIDGVIDHYVGAPLPTTSIKDNAKRISFRYKLETVPGSSTGKSGVAYANQIYSLTILKPSLKAVITMKPIRYRNTFRDTGICKIIK